MAKKISRASPSALGAICAASLFFTGCVNGPDGMFGVLTGVLSWSRQNWAAASFSFLETLDKAVRTDDQVLREYAAYGLASTYLAQDEYDAALARLSELGDAAAPGIRAGAWYQAGIIEYRRGQFAEAASNFRKSLENDPSGMDAKINLELSRLSLVERQTDRSSSSSGIREDSEADQQAETIFNLIRKKEQDRWKNQDGETAESGAADY